MLGFADFADLVQKQQKALGERDRQDKDRIANFLGAVSANLEKAVLSYKANDLHHFHQACENLWFHIWIGRCLIYEAILPPLSMMLDDRLIEAGKDWDEIGAPTGAFPIESKTEAALNRLSRASGILLGAAQYLRARPESSLDRIKLMIGRLRAYFWRDSVKTAARRPDWPYIRSDGTLPGYSIKSGGDVEHLWSGTARRYVPVER